MQVERDILHEHVFPELRRRLSRYGEDLQELDLRWGVDTTLMSEEESSLAVIETCIDGINRCRPYMIVLLGNRYGWIPDQTAMDHVSDNRVKDVYRGEMSITQMEIEYGALSNQENLSHTVFCFRNEDFPAAVPASFRKDYDSEDDRHREKLQELKKSILDQGKAEILQYQASWDAQSGIVTGDFEEKITEALWKLILKDLPQEKPVMFPEQKVLQNANARRKQYVQSYISKKEDRNAPIYAQGGWFYGGPGSGKSALMAKVATGLKKIDVPVFLYFCENAGCGNIHTLLSSLVFFLDRLTGKEQRSYEGADNNMLLRLAVDGLQESSKLDFAILIDAVDRMDAEALDLITILYRANYRKKKPGEPEPFYCILVSSTDDYYQANKAQIDGITTATKIAPLTESELVGMVHLHAKRRAKQIDEDVMDVIRSREETRTPYYLSLLLQRLFMMDQEDFRKADSMGAGMAGISAYMQQLVRELPDTSEEMTLILLDETYRKMNRRIAGLQASVPGKTLARPQEILQLLACSRYGLTIEEISRLLEAEGKFFLPVLLEQIFVYLYDSFEQSEQGVWNFSHRLIRESLQNSMDAQQRNRNYRLLLDAAMSQSREGAGGDAFFYACRAEDMAAGLALMENAKDLGDTFRLLLQDEQGRCYLSGLFHSGNDPVRRNLLLQYIGCGNLIVLHPEAGRNWMTELKPGETDREDLRYLYALAEMKLAFFDLDDTAFTRARETAEALHEQISPELRQMEAVEALYAYREPVSAKSYGEKSAAAYASNDLKHVLDLEESSYKMLWELLVIKDEALADHNTEQFEQWHSAFATNRGAWILSLHRRNQARVLKKLGREYLDKTVEGLKFLEPVIRAVGEDRVAPDVLRAYGELYALKADAGLANVGKWELEHREEQKSDVRTVQNVFRKLLDRHSLVRDLMLIRDVDRIACLYCCRTQNTDELTEWINELYRHESAAEDYLKTTEDYLSAVEARLDLAEILFRYENDSAARECADRASELWNSEQGGRLEELAGKEKYRSLHTRLKFLTGIGMIKQNDTAGVHVIHEGAEIARQNYLDSKSVYSFMQLEEGHVLVADVAEAMGKEDLLAKLMGDVSDFSYDRYKAFSGIGEEYRRLLCHKASGFRKLANQDQSPETCRKAEKIFHAMAASLPGGDFSQRPEYMNEFRKVVVFLWRTEKRLDAKTADILATTLLSKSRTGSLDDTEAFLLEKSMKEISRVELLWNEELQALAAECAARVKDANGIAYMSCRKVLQEILRGDAESARRTLDEQTRSMTDEEKKESCWIVLQYLDQVLKAFEGSRDFSLHTLDNLYKVCEIVMKKYYPSPLLMEGVTACHDYITALLKKKDAQVLPAIERFADYADRLIERVKHLQTEKSEGAYKSYQSQLAFARFITGDKSSGPLLNTGNGSRGFLENSRLGMMENALMRRLLDGMAEQSLQVTEETFLSLGKKMYRHLGFFTDPSGKTENDVRITGTLNALSIALADCCVKTGAPEKAFSQMRSRIGSLLGHADFRDPATVKMLDGLYRKMRGIVTEYSRKTRFMKDLLDTYQQITTGAYRAGGGSLWIRRYLEESERVRGMMREANAELKEIYPTYLDDLRVAGELPEKDWTKEIVSLCMPVIDAVIEAANRIEPDPMDMELVLHMLFLIKRSDPAMKQAVSTRSRQATVHLESAFDLIMYVMHQAMKQQKQEEVEKDLEGWCRMKRREMDEKQVD